MSVSVSVSVSVCVLSVCVSEKERVSVCVCVCASHILYLKYKNIFNYKCYGINIRMYLTQLSPSIKLYHYYVKYITLIAHCI